MTIEHITSRRLRWPALLGLILVPVLVAGGLLAANWGSDSRTRTVQAAVVNLDKPVTVNGTYTPLGRQLTAALVDSDRVENLDWVLASEDGAREGLTTGQYAAMVTIPEDFSAAATSFGGDADKAERATIRVETSPVAGLADATRGKVVANEAASMLNQTLTSGYLDAIYVGFNDMGEQFVSVADGAGELADGVDTYVEGIGKAADGGAQLADGADKLSSGLATMASQTKDLKKAPKLGAGAQQLADGLQQMAKQTKGLADAPKLGAGARQTADGVAQYVGGVDQLIDQTLDGLDQQAQLAALLGQVDPRALQAMAAELAPQAATDPTIAAGLQQLQVLMGALSSLDVQPPEGDPAADLELLRRSGAALASGTDELATQTEKLTGGLPALAKGIKQSADGASDLADGAKTLTGGLPKLADGIGKTADGASQLADGANDLANGLLKASNGGQDLADGAHKLADGLAEGKDKLPSYSESDRKTLSEVVSEPIETTNLVGTAGFGPGWVSLLLVLALWLGALATFVVVKAVSGRLLGSARPTAYLVAQAVLPGAVVVAVQTVVVTAIGQWALQLSAGTLLAVFAVLLLAGLTFVMVNHALVAWFGGIGRLVAAALAVLALASAITTAAPEVFGVVAAFSPLTPALDAVRGLIVGAPDIAPSVYILLGWLVVALAASAVAVARSRTTTFAALLKDHGLAA